MVMLRGPQIYFLRISCLFLLLAMSIEIIAAGVRPQPCSAGWTRDTARLIIWQLNQISLRTEKCFWQTTLSAACVVNRRLVLQKN